MNVPEHSDSCVVVSCSDIYVQTLSESTCEVFVVLHCRGWSSGLPDCIRCRDRRQDTLEADLKDFKSLNAWSDDAPGADGLITKDRLLDSQSCFDAAVAQNAQKLTQKLVFCLGQ